MLGNHGILRRPLLGLAITATALTLALAAACGSSSQPEPTTATDAAQSATVNIRMDIANRATSLTREDLRVTQGDTVRVAFTADEPGEIHLHGYDLTADVAPGSPGELEFKAEAAGAFGINFHVFANDGMSQNGEAHSHGPSDPQVISDDPLSVDISAQVDDAGAVDVQINTTGFRFAPELVDQPHVPGKGHGHVYVNGEKLGRIFDSEYRVDELPPGEHEIRVALYTNDHSILVFDGAPVESIATVTVPDVGQGHSGHGSDDGHGHDSHDHATEREIIAEVHLGNLEVYP